MNTRAERRRQMRALGRKRAPGKRGRRPAIRGGAAVTVTPGFEALERAGFVLARPEVRRG